VTEEEWVAEVAEVARGLSKTMPDMYPSGYATYLAEQYAAEGGYQKYITGGFAPGKLWEPTHV
jgi:hypothetical protein